MKPEDVAQRHASILSSLSYLPRKMLSIHGSETMPEFVLYELCHEQCFNLNKAAYFVDNPDFDCFKGIAGFSHGEAAHGSDIWADQEQFVQKMQQSAFNKQVKEVIRSSIKRSASSEKAIAQWLAKTLGMEYHGHCSWNMKHDNHGLLLFEKVSHTDVFTQEHLLNGVSLLSFCPIV